MPRSDALLANLYCMLYPCLEGPFGTGMANAFEKEEKAGTLLGISWYFFSCPSGWLIQWCFRCFFFFFFFYMSKSCTLFSMPNIFFCIISTWKYQVPVRLFCWNSCQPGSASGFVHSELLGYIERGVHFITQALTFESLLCHCLIKLWSLCALFGAGVNVTLL